jgi:hypothetical protein
MQTISDDNVEYIYPPSRNRESRCNRVKDPKGHTHKVNDPKGHTRRVKDPKGHTIIYIHYRRDLACISFADQNGIIQSSFDSGFHHERIEPHLFAHMSHAIIEPFNRTGLKWDDNYKNFEALFRKHQQFAGHNYGPTASIIKALPGLVKHIFESDLSCYKLRTSYHKISNVRNSLIFKVVAADVLFLIFCSFSTGTGILFRTERLLPRH